MTMQTLKIGKREFVLLARRDFDKLAAPAQKQLEDDYWTNAAHEAEQKARTKGEKPIPFEYIERELDERRKRRTKARRSAR